MHFFLKWKNINFKCKKLQTESFNKSVQDKGTVPINVKNMDKCGTVWHFINVHINRAQKFRRTSSVKVWLYCITLTLFPTIYDKMLSCHWLFSGCYTLFSNRVQEKSHSGVDTNKWMKILLKQRLYSFFKVTYWLSFVNMVRYSGAGKKHGFFIFMFWQPVLTPDSSHLSVPLF